MNKNLFRLKKVIDFDGMVLYPQKMLNNKYWDFIYDDNRKAIKFYSFDAAKVYLKQLNNEE